MLDYPVGGGKLKVLIFGSDDQLQLINKQAPESDPSLRGRFSNHNWFHTLFTSYKKTTQRWDIESTIAVGPQHFDASLADVARFNLDLVEITRASRRAGRSTNGCVSRPGLDLQMDYFWATVDAPRITTEEKIQGPLSKLDHLILDNHGFEANPALYLSADIAAGDRLLITPGVRVDWFSGTPHTYVQPRLMMRLRIAERTFLKAGAGLFEQPPQAPYGDAVLGNPHIRAEEAWHLDRGNRDASHPEIPAVFVGIESVLQEHLVYRGIVRNQFILSGGRIKPESYSDEGIGRVYGGDILLKHDSNKYVYGWIAYTLEKSERQDHKDQPWRPFQYDQTHILTLVLGTHLPWEVDFGIRLRYVTGNPDTPILSALYDADHDVYVPMQGAPYSSRLPDFFQLDARIDKRIIFKSWVLSIYLDVTNVTNNANVEGYTYSYDYQKRTAVTGLPILPSLGIRASF